MKTIYIKNNKIEMTINTIIHLLILLTLVGLTILQALNIYELTIANVSLMLLVAAAVLVPRSPPKYYGGLLRKDACKINGYHKFDPEEMEVTCDVNTNPFDLILNCVHCHKGYILGLRGCGWVEKKQRRDLA